MNTQSPKRRGGAFLSVLAIMALNVGIIAPAVVMAANPSADLDQCANGQAPSPSSDGCNPAEWVNGNLGASKSVYSEGDSIPYRLKFANLSLSSHTVTIEWDTTKSGEHALDYIDDFNESVLDANPCAGISTCNTFSEFGIPSDTQVTGAGVTPNAGKFRIYGGTVTAVSAYTYPNGAGFAGDKSARLTVTFTASKANPVLAWGGHIATRLDWGSTASAVAISGSPYHTRLVNLDGSGGNQDRSLSADAVIFPGFIHIVKTTSPSATNGTFNFTASPSPLSNFSIVTANGSGQQNFDNIKTFTTYTVAETVPGGWALTGLTCAVASPNGGTRNVTSPSVSINLKEGEQVTCTFANTANAPALSIVKTSSTTNYDSVGDVITYSIVATNTGNTTLTSVTITDTEAALGTCTPANGSSLAPGATLTCAATHTVTQADIDAGTYNNTACVDDGAAGAAQVCGDADVPADQNDNLGLSKSDDLNPAKYEDAGDVVTFTITATNNGNTTLHNVTVSDVPALDDFACTPTIPVASLAPGASIVCTGTHSITNGDITAGFFKDTASASSDEDAAPDADDTVYGKAQPSVATTDTLIPQDSIVMSDLTTDATGDLYVELRIDETCGQDGTPAYSKTWSGAISNTTPYVTANTVAVSDDATVRWCVSYSGDNNNANIPLADHGEVAVIDFEPFVAGAVGAGFAIPMLLVGAWNRRRRQSEA